MTRGSLVLASALTAAAVGATLASSHGSELVLAAIGALAMLAFVALATASRGHSRRLRDRQRALRAHNARLDVAINNIAQAVSMFDENERLVLCNERYARMYGLPPALTQPGTPLSTLLQYRARHGTLSDDPARLRQALLQTLAEGRRTRHLVETADGRTISIINHPLAGGGWVATHEDISDLRRAEREAQQAHARLREAIEAMPVGVVIFDADHRLVMQNQRMDEFYPETSDLRSPGTRFEDLLRSSAQRGVILEAIGREEEWLSERLARLTRPMAVREQVLSNGRWIRVADCATADGGFIGIRVDITELKRREQELAVQNTRFGAAVGNISQGLIMYDAQQRLVLCNQRYADLYELPRDLLRPGQTTMADVLAYRKANGTFPGDAEAFRRMRVAAIANGEVERRTIEIKGGRTIAVISQPLPDGSWVATHEDITDRRKAEQELARAEQFLDQVIQNVPSAIIVKDASSGRYLHVNRAAETFLGLRREEIIGKTPSDVYPPEHAQWIAMRDAEMLRSGGTLLSDEVPVQTVHNGVRMVNTRRMTIAGPDGDLDYLLVVNEDVTERRQVEARIAHMAHHDALTGLPNRVRFHERLAEALGSVAAGASLAVICLDLDHFKSVNDTLGHSFGDELLKQVAERLRACVQDDDMVARLGGDEFAVIQGPIRHPTETALLVQRIGAAIKQPFEIAGHQVDIDVSIGISLAPADAREPDTLLKNADLALYGAKGAGRGTYRFFQPEMDARMKARHQLDTDLRKALAAGELALHYQPIVSLADQSVLGYEALLRWHHPERGEIPPAQFIPIAEETGLIGPLGEWALRRACAAAATWPDHLTLAVNLSPVQFKRNLLAAVSSALAASGLSPRRLELEITEAALLHDDQATMSILHQLRQLGIRIVMDDFGTGYSSLSYLRQFPFDKIKIDRSFIGGLLDQNSASIVQAIVELAASLKMTTTAEGIETADQLERLCAIGCVQGQGYLFGRPAPEHEALGRSRGSSPRSVSAA